MKTIAFNGNGNANWARAFFVVAALGGLYYFRRQGGSVSDLLAKGTDGLKQARTMISRVAPPLAKTQSVATSAQI